MEQRTVQGLSSIWRVPIGVSRRKTILWLSDHPLIPSGVGVQARYSIEQLLGTGAYRFVCLGGAIKHPDYNPQMVSPDVFGEGNWIIHPVDGHGNKDQLRRFLADERPDAIVLFTDPRFFTWIWEMEDEIRAVCPIVYWHVWDNDPTPDFNMPIYEATDHILTLSLKTYGLLQGMGYPSDRFSYVPHAEPAEVFRPLSDEEVREARIKHYGPYADREFIVMWNNRNARRKMTGDVMESFARLADKVGRERVALLMHTAANDQEGQDIHALSRQLKIEDILLLSEGRVPAEQLNLMYNCADCVINISSNEGFGLGTLEALYAGVPIVVNMTGGLQFQIGDWWCDQSDFSDQDHLTCLARSRRNSHRWWGVPVFPVARNLVGSQQVPYIYDDRVSDRQVADALEKVFKMGRTQRRRIGLEAREWAMEKFGMNSLRDGWVNGIETAIAHHASRRSSMIGNVRLSVI